MKINLVFLFITVTLLSACSSNGPVPPPSSADTDRVRVKYALWTDEQLELQRAKLKDRLQAIPEPVPPSDPNDLSASMGNLAVSMKRHEEEKEIEDMAQKLLRRDPSGSFLAKSNGML